MGKQIKKIKLRKAVKTFFDGKILSAKHCIESKDGITFVLEYGSGKKKEQVTITGKSEKSIEKAFMGWLLN